jgi:hypothetical protein
MESKVFYHGINPMAIEFHQFLENSNGMNPVTNEINIPLQNYKFPTFSTVCEILFL